MLDEDFKIPICDVFQCFNGQVSSAGRLSVLPSPTLRAPKPPEFIAAPRDTSDYDINK